MSVEMTDGLPVGMVVVDAGIEFAVEWGGGDSVEVHVDHLEPSGWTGVAVATRTVTISREDWEAIVAHVAVPPLSEEQR